ncbi:MAG: hypothetical protein F4207_10360 [Gemmatimonadetes bacterium]|nr:hypothetical protein [Gemmatimonadota bacterium]MYG16809.1 hypothetical protein [Gemmatimonadota bacterium]
MMHKTSKNQVWGVSVTTALLLMWGGCIFSPTEATEPIPTTINVSSTLLYLGIGESVSIEAVVLDENRLPIEDAPLNWSSSEPEIVSVNNQGVLTVHSFGRADITVKSGASEATVVVIVSKDRAALVAIYNALGGPAWENSANWASSFPISAWHGVTVSPDDRVTELNLWGNGLSGVLPAALGDLDELRILDLGGNSITGNIPGAVGQLRNLEEFRIAHANLSGEIPASLGNFPKLRILALGMNDLSGSIPSSLGNLVNLEGLWLYENALSGEIPGSVGRLENLVDLSLSSNRITGSIPSELGNMSSLRFISLQNNGLSGQIPPELGNLAVLEELRLSNNQLSGSIPPELGGLGNLDLLYLNHNIRLTGALPFELTQLTMLRSLDLIGTGLCAPTHPDFRAWLEMVRGLRFSNTLGGVVFCSGN